MPGKNLRLLCLDGGGVRGLSSLFILQELMAVIDRDNPPNPCDYFHLIGGTSTGGWVFLLPKVCYTITSNNPLRLIAIMLGRLRMTIAECLAAYRELFGVVFVKRHSRLTLLGNTQGKFDTPALEKGIKNIIYRKLGGQRGCENALFQEGNGTDVRCKV